VRIALAVHAWPPEGSGGTERSVRALAFALARAGAEVAVLAGSLKRAEGKEVQLERSRERDPASGAQVELLLVHRPDLYFDHWHKSANPAVTEIARQVLSELGIEVLHVHHWLRLSRDLVHGAALQGVPSVVTLHDAWVSCLVAFRVRPDTHAPCSVRAGADPCVACAGIVPPRTPWVPVEEAWLAFARRQQDLARELVLARALTTPTQAHAATLERFLGLSPGTLHAHAVPPARLKLAEAPPRGLKAPAEEGRLRLASWGGLEPHKGIDLVLDALEIEPLPGRSQLALVGAGSATGYMHTLRNRAVGLHVRFLGPSDPEHLAERVGLAHCFVTGTRAAESYGLALDEALDLGLPIVAPRTPAFTERFFDGRAALLYEPDDAASLAAMLARLLREPDLWPRLRAEARALSAALPDANVVAQQCLALYERAREAGPPAVRAPAWYEMRMVQEALQVWDQSLSRCSAAQLGLEP
jgi:glycosyltransferase involved in cell wall biosynthesis